MTVKRLFFRRFSAPAIRLDMFINIHMILIWKAKKTAIGQDFTLTERMLSSENSREKIVWRIVDEIERGMSLIKLKKVEKHQHDSSFSVAARVFRFISTWLFFRNKMLLWLFCFHLHIKWAWVKLQLLLWYQILLKQTFDYIFSWLSFIFMIIL